MKRMISAVAVLAMSITAFGAQAAPTKSALDGYQFDGVEADGALKTAGWTRRHWIEMYPVQAKEYWAAWACKGKPCDSKWNANIRAKAVLIPRTEKDPKPAAADAASSH